MYLMIITNITLTITFRVLKFVDDMQVHIDKNRGAESVPESSG